MSIFFSTSNNKPLLFCHRGIHTKYPENSLPAFETCLKDNFNAIETDIHICKSGELFILHDFNLKRMTGTDKTIEELTYDEIKKLEIKSENGYKGLKIPTLREVFALCSDNILYDLELKSNIISNKNLAEKTWKLINEFNLPHNCIVTSFNPFATRAFESISHNGLQTGVIYSEDPAVPKIFQHGFGSKLIKGNILKPEFKQLNSKKAYAYKKKNYKIIPWTVDDVNVAKEMISYNIYGIVTNNPYQLKETGFFN